MTTNTNPQSRSWRWLRFLATLLAGAVTLCILLPSQDSDLGNDWVRHTIRLSLLLYTAAACLMMSLRADEWNASTFRGQLARLAWLLACEFYLVHVILAMKFAHHWSHAHAIGHTQERSGFGEGIFISHFFTLVWTFDVLWWEFRPASYARRSPWVDRLLHAFMAFMIFCGTVVYETGFIRWAGLTMFLLLGSAFLYRLAAGKPQGESLMNSVSRPSSADPAAHLSPQRAGD